MNESTIPTAAPKPLFDLSALKTEQERQYAQLLNEVVARIESRQHGVAELSEKDRAAIVAQARDIERISTELADYKRSAVERFQQIVNAHANNRGGYRGPFADVEQARHFGRAVAAIVRRDHAALAELQKAAILPTSGPAGGYLLHEQLINDLIRNVEDAGQFEANCPAFPVSTLKGGVPTRTSGLTVYYPDYGVAGTPSTPAFGKKNYDLKRHVVGVELENWMLASELAVALADYAVTEMAYALALASDTNWFLGDGTSTYCGYTGVFKLPSGVQTVIGASGDDTFAEMIDKTTLYLGEALGKLPLWAHRAGPKWYGHLSVFFRYLGARDSTGQPVNANILAAAGGTPQFVLMGYPFVPVQIAPAVTATAVSTCYMVLAALSRACGVFRHRGAIELKSSEHVKFWENMTVLAADVPQDMVIRDGNAIVQLITAAS